MRPITTSSSTRNSNGPAPGTSTSVGSMRSPRPTGNSSTAPDAMRSSATTTDPSPGPGTAPTPPQPSPPTMMDNEQPGRDETPAWYGRGADSINTELAACRELMRDLDAMAPCKMGTRWHRDRVRQLAIVIRGLTRRGLLTLTTDATPPAPAPARCLGRGTDVDSL